MKNSSLKIHEGFAKDFVGELFSYKCARDLQGKNSSLNKKSNFTSS